MSGDYLEIVSKSEDDTIRIGITIASNLSADVIVLLTGPLGAGKSVLARGIARGLGYEGRVRSPSFTVERVYNTPRGELHHWDLYRLEKTGEIEPVFDEIRSQDGIRIVEWGDRLNDFMHDEFPSVDISFTDEIDVRKLRIDKRLMPDNK